MTIEITAIEIPQGLYFTKAQAAQILGLQRVSLQHHIAKGHLATIKLPGLGHIINEEDLKAFSRNPVGRPGFTRKDKRMTEEKILEQAYEWACINNNPTTWALGHLNGNVLHHIQAIVERQKNGYWHWRLLDNLDNRRFWPKQGCAPSRALAMKDAEAALSASRSLAN